MKAYRRALLFILEMSVLLNTLAMNSRFYTSEELSSNQITSLCQDRQGYIWIGTEYGLNKFDGVHFTQYYNDDTNPQSLSDDIIRCLMSDREGNVWVVSNQGVQRYNRNTDAFDNVTFEENTAHNANDILQTPDGEIWILCASEGVYKIDTSDLSAHPLLEYNKHISRECNNMLVDSKDRLWIGHSGPSIQMIDIKTGESRIFENENFKNNLAVDFTEDENGQILVATYTNILRFDDKRGDFKPVIEYPRMSVHCLYDNGNGQLIIGTSGNGMWQLDLDKQTCSHVEIDNVVPDNVKIGNEKVHALLRDRNGNKWIGYHQRGLLYVDDESTPFHYLPLSQLQTNNGNVLRAVFADSKNHIYLCQEKGGITEIGTNGQSLRHMMDDYTVMNIHEDKDGIFWVGTYRNGLFKVNPDSGKSEWIEASGSKRISDITQDKEGNLYTAVFGIGLRSYTPDGKTERNLGGGNLALSNPYLNILFPDKEGMIWIGHYYGIDIYDPKTDRLLDLELPAALRPAIVYDIKQTQDGKILVGSNKGLFQYNKEDLEDPWKRLTTKEGLPNNIICSINTASDGSVWIGTYRGLAQIKPDGQISSFYRGNGLDEWSFLRGVSSTSSSGNIVMGNLNGVTYFDPDNIVKDDFEQGITLTKMRVGNVDVNTGTLSNGKHIITKPLDATENITVSYEDNTFSLCFSSMDFRDAQNIHYEYRFKDEPKDEWHQTASGVSEIFFTHLSVGTHCLQVRACDNGEYSPVKTLYIHVTPPWYRSWWAYLIYFLIAAGIVALWWHNYWSRKQAEIKEEKIKFFVDISHELRSPLTLIKSPLEKLLKSSYDPQTTRALRNMERNTNRLLTLVNQILSLRKMEKGQMTLHYAEIQIGDFIGNICHDFDYQLEKRQINLQFKNEAPELKVWIDCDNFDKVVSNLLSNAIKYIPDGGEITVILRQKGAGSAELTVRDNGPGIDEAQLRKIFERFYQASARPTGGQMSYGIGLNLTQKIVELHGGTIIARNRADSQGSEFIVTIPLGYSHLPKDQLVGNDYYSVQGTEEGRIDTAAQDIKSSRVRKKTNYQIAVVDDDDEIRTFLETELGDSYKVHVYADGQQAFEGIVETLPNLVVSDVVMPKMDGFELLKRLKSSTKTSHIPVVLLTTKTAHQSRIQGLDYGADAYVDKPFNLEELEAIIAGLIANRNRVKGKYSGIQEQEETVRKIELKGNDAVLMEKIMKAINDRIDDSDFNVEALADTIGLSRVQLHRRVKEITGISVGEFIRNLRLQQAAKLLAEGDTTVSQVTYAVGFANPAHFSTAFKKHFGVTPSEYIAKHKK